VVASLAPRDPTILPNLLITNVNYNAERIVPRQQVLPAQ